MKLNRSLGMLSVVVLSGCGSFAWKVESKPPVWAATDWTKDLGKVYSTRKDGDVVFVGAEKGVYAMKAGGEKLWATPEMSPAHRYITVGEGRVIVSSYTVADKSEKRHGFSDRTASNVNRRENGHLTAFNTADGAQVWDVPFDVDASRMSPPSVGGGKVVLMADRKLVAYDLSNGSPAWAQQMVGETGIWKMLAGMPFSRVQPAIVDGKVCAQAMFHAGVYDLATGSPIAEDNLSGSGYMDAAPIAANGMCYFGRSRNRLGGMMTGANQVFAIDLGVVTAKKKFKWAWDTKMGDLGVGALAATAKGLVAETNSTVKLLDAKTGKELWAVEEAPVSPVGVHHGTRFHHVDSFTAGFTMDMSNGMTWNDWPGTGFVATDSKIFLIASYEDKAAKAKRDVVTGLDTGTGAYLGSFDAQGATITDLLVTGDGTLVVGTDQGIKTAKVDSFAAALPPAKK